MSRLRKKSEKHSIHNSLKKMPSNKFNIGSERPLQRDYKPLKKEIEKDTRR
jgi:hypothetical protein